ncbi:hypothetical protein [Propylenella binzhouense]|uniref:Uncharacterized protein n=1 Tax=Propylenella binzhouense TaxID=2555902 RepID=A0A964T9Z7_9HYPH|nr:hypothetical protein [Propylenella binzhouense]MYZ50052.1 hypothetical protein [Propylenella binzhouense]
MKRFDDIVRSERYFTATLLPALLFHDEFRGLEEFIKLVNERACTERGADGEPLRRSQPDASLPSDLSNCEIITEFHIARDLKAAGLRLEEAEEDTRDAPDLVVLFGNEMIACEGKCFSKNVEEASLRKQLRSQQRQLSHLFEIENYRRIDTYLHVAIIPSKVDLCYDADCVLSWKDIHNLALAVLGAEHYITKRFANLVDALDRRGDPNLLNYDGRLDFDMMCSRASGDSGIQVGVGGGESALRAMSGDEIKRRYWKWRNPESNKGTVIRSNWIDAPRWLEIIRGKGLLQSS